MRQLVLLTLLAFSGLCAGCGHPATERECEEIVERVATLELKNAHAGEEQVESEVKLAKASFKKDVSRRCVGRRVTQAAMNCVRQAQSADQIEKECFR
jgi:hypothetical protein